MKDQIKVALDTKQVFGLNCMPKYYKYETGKCPYIFQKASRQFFVVPFLKWIEVQWVDKEADS